MLPKTGVNGKDIVSIKKLQGQKVRYGAKQPDAGELRNIFSFELLGLDAETIFGLARGEVRQAMMRGELQLNHDTAESYSSSVQSLVDAGQVVPLWTLGFPQGREDHPRPCLPRIFPQSMKPMWPSNGNEPQGPAYEAFKAFVNLGVAASKGFALPEGTPDTIRNVYIEAVKENSGRPRIQEARRGRGRSLPAALRRRRRFRDQAGGWPLAGGLQWLKEYLHTRFDLKI